MSAKTDNPGTLGILQEAQRPAMEICRAVYEGTLFLRDSPRFLPQAEMEEEPAYLARLAEAVLFNAFKKTVRALTGIVFREDPVLWEDGPKEIEAHAENIDLAGRHLDLFAAQQFKDKLIDGHVHILVDWHGPEGARSMKDERSGMARPYWTLIRKGQVLRFWTRQDGGVVVLYSFAYQEEETVQDGAFAQKEVRRIRQFDLTDQSGTPFDPLVNLPIEAKRRVLFRSWTQTEEGGEWKPDDGGAINLLGPRMTKIPVVTDYADRTGYMRSDPPLIDLALENLKHWQIRSDRDRNLHVTSIPIFNVYGLEAKDLQTVTVGNAMGLAFPKGRQEQGSEYVEAMGHGLKHTREELLDIQQRMASLGLSMLERQLRQAETEEAKKLDAKAQDSELAGQARATSDALEEAMGLHALWMGIAEGGGSVYVNTEFDMEEMSPELFDKYLKAVGEGKLSVETMWDRLVVGRLLPDTFDPKLEKELIANEGTAQMEAMAEVARRMREEQQPDQAENEGAEEDEDEEGTKSGKGLLAVDVQI